MRIRCETYTDFVSRICKQVHAEVESLYLGANLLYLPANFRHLHSFISSRRQGRHLFSRAVCSNVLNIAIDFKVTGAFKLDSATDFWKYHEENHIAKFEELTAAQRGEMISQLQHRDIQNHWLNLHYNLANFNKKMDYVEAGFTHAFCAVGYCRLHVNYGTRALAYLKAKTLIVRGMRTGEAVNMNFDGHHKFTMRELQRIYGFHEMKKDEETKWEAWKE